MPTEVKKRKPKQENNPEEEIEDIIEAKKTKKSASEGVKEAKVFDSDVIKTEPVSEAKKEPMTVIERKEPTTLVDKKEPAISTVKEEPRVSTDKKSDYKEDWRAASVFTQDDATKTERKTNIRQEGQKTLFEPEKTYTSLATVVNLEDSEYIPNEADDEVGMFMWSGCPEKANKNIFGGNILKVTWMPNTTISDVTLARGKEEIDVPCNIDIFLIQKKHDSKRTEDNSAALHLPLNTMNYTPHEDEGKLGMFTWDRCGKMKLGNGTEAEIGEVVWMPYKRELEVTTKNQSKEDDTPYDIEIRMTPQLQN